MRVLEQTDSKHPSLATPAADGKIPVLKGRESGFKKYQGGPLKYIDCGQKVLNPVLLSLLSHDHGGHAGAPNVNFRKISVRKTI